MKGIFGKWYYNWQESNRYSEKYNMIFNRLSTKLSRDCHDHIGRYQFENTQVTYVSYVNGYNDIRTTCVRMCKLHNDCLNILLLSVWNIYVHTLPLLIFKFISNFTDIHTLLTKRQMRTHCYVHIYYIIYARNILATMTSRGSPYARCIRDTLEYTQTLCEGRTREIDNRVKSASHRRDCMFELSAISAVWGAEIRNGRLILAN